MELKQIIEGSLLVSGRTLSLKDMQSMFTEDEQVTKEAVLACLQDITDDCAKKGFELKQLASGYCFQVKPDYAKWVSKLWEEKPPRLSKALLETLTIVAYKQPVTRADIESIRGVVVSSTAIRNLLDKQWIKIVGHKDAPGRPAIFGTTKEFLDYFNMSGLDELPIIDINKIDFSKVAVADDTPKGFRLVDVDAALPDNSNVIDASTEFQQKVSSSSIKGDAVG